MTKEKKAKFFIYRVQCGSKVRNYLRSYNVQSEKFELCVICSLNPFIFNHVT